MTSPKTLFPNKVTLTGTRLELQHIFWGDTSQPLHLGELSSVFSHADHRAAAFALSGSWLEVRNSSYSRPAGPGSAPHKPPEAPRCSTLTPSPFPALLHPLLCDFLGSASPSITCTHILGSVSAVGPYLRQGRGPGLFGPEILILWRNHSPRLPVLVRTKHLTMSSSHPGRRWKEERGQEMGLLQGKLPVTPGTREADCL